MPESNSATKRKRKRLDQSVERKLLVGKNDEVRSVEESLVSATVIGSCDYGRKSGWTRFDADILHGTESCSNAIAEYALSSAGYRRPPNALTENVRKLLSHLGWKIEFMNKDMPRFRYTSPQGKTYQSLRQVCLDLGGPAMRTDCQISQDEQRTLCSSHDDVTKSQVSEQEKTDPCRDDDLIDIDREYCPHAVINYYSLGLDKKDYRRKDSVTSNLIAKAKKHLSFMGWLFWYAYKKGKRELRYCSPKGRCYYSLRTACKACMDEGGASEDTSTCSPMKIMNVSEESEVQEFAPPMIDMRMQKNLVQQNVETEKRAVKSSNRSQFKSRRMKRHDGLQLVVSNSLQHYAQINGALVKLNNLDGNYATPALQSRKSAHQGPIPDSSNNSQTILSQLIDNNVVLCRAKVHYSSQKDHHPMPEGKIARDGIKNSCCQEVFSPRGFEAHAGSSFHQSDANIFLEDEGSLLECQRQMVHRITGKSFTKESSHGKKSNGDQCNNDDICSVCHYGGDLVLCDQCPSCFHQSCLGLKELPEGDWFCPSCCCRICGENRFDEYSEEDNFKFSCHQCELQYHVGCLRKQRHVKLETYPDGTRFCSTQCEKIFLGLLKLLGKPIPVGVDNLTWTLLKPTISEWFDMDVPDNKALTEVYSKLNIALNVMHECFEPIKEPHTGRDLVEDVIFCRGSDLKRLNFRGFYIVLLERNDELISVATIRVHGEKVAEVPLVGTRSQYRRLGMCRILINEIEKKLMELGVERLTLPAAPSVLDTWVTSFGFSKMTDSERLTFLDHTFLDFQDTVMCQKLLMKIPSTKSSQSTGPWSKHNTEFDRHSAESEVLQAEQVEESAIVAEGITDTTSGNGIDGSKSTASLATDVTDFEWRQRLDEDMLELLLKDDHHNENSLEGLLKDHDHDECSLEGLLKDDNHDENILECLLKDDDNHKTSRDDGDGYYRCYKRRRISAYDS
ncbi:uncharacterized protein LOC117916041 isoform X2 [Vitis riparia]|uniref:uncharacterized protein LOC117916041 isoform X2 n=1 Tax=Vitis riparia TaxID=96939 RepID=UPI00155A18FC|nr:uncharacterized protein LOC117916041 isoform X2 [Vitis riparia]